MENNIEDAAKVVKNEIHKNLTIMDVGSSEHRPDYIIAGIDNCASEIAKHFDYALADFKKKLKEEIEKERAKNHFDGELENFAYRFGLHQAFKLMDNLK